MNDDHIGLDLIADYALYFLNKCKNFSYVDVFNLKQPSDNISEVLFHIAINSYNLRPVRAGN